MRVLQYAPARVRGGLLSHVEILSRGLLGMGVRLDVVLSPVPAIDPLARSLQQAGAGVHRLEVTGKTDLRGMRSLRRLIAACVPDVAHVHLSSPVEASLALLAIRSGGTRIATTEHAPTFHPLRRFYSAGVKRWVARRVAAVVAVCRSDAAFLVEEFGLPSGLVRVIPNGVPRPRPMQAVEARRLLGLGEGRGLIVGYAGRLEPRKGIAELIDAVALPGGGVRVLALAGEGPLASGLPGTVGEGTEVRRLGRLEELGPFLAAIDVFVLPSHGEAMPLVLLEAMRAGRPIIATRVGGIPEAIEDGRNGLLVAPGDRDRLRAAMVRMRDDPDLRRRLAEQARLDGDGRFSQERMVAEVVRLYRELTGSPGGS